MPRVTLFIPSLAGGGAERAFVNLAKGFVQRKIDVDMVLLRAEGPYLKDLPSQVKIFNLQAPEVPFRWAKLRRYMIQRHTYSTHFDLSVKAHLVALKLAGYLRSKQLNFLLLSWLLSSKLADYIRWREPNAVLSALTNCNLILLLSRNLNKFRPYLAVSEHNTPSISWAQNPVGGMWIKLAQKLYPQANVVVAVSQGVADDLFQLLRVQLQQIQIIYNPIVTRELFVKSQEPIDCDWFLRDKLPVILAVGRLTKQKDFPTLLKAFALVRQIRPVRLVILGEGEERLSLEHLAKALGIQNDVFMPGFVENPFAFMARASVFVLSSAWEGFGNVIVEALACGCPVVSTDCRSGPSEILDNGRYGRLVPVGDPEALAKAILETLDDPDKPADRETRIKRAMEFSVDAAVDKYLKVLLGRNA